MASTPQNFHSESFRKRCKYPISKPCGVGDTSTVARYSKWPFSHIWFHTTNPKVTQTRYVTKFETILFPLLRTNVEKLYDAKLSLSFLNKTRNHYSCVSSKISISTKKEKQVIIRKTICLEFQARLFLTSEHGLPNKIHFSGSQAASLMAFNLGMQTRKSQLKLSSCSPGTNYWFSSFLPLPYE